MKIIKRIAGMFLAAIILTVCLSISAFADNAATETGTIIIRNNKSKTNISIVGKTYSAYKLFDLAHNEDNTAYVYTLNRDFKEFFESDQFEEAFSDTEAADDIYVLAERVKENNTSTSAIYSFVSALQSNSADINRFAAAVYSFAQENNITPQTADIKIEKDAVSGQETGNETAVFSDIALGYYLIYGEGSALNAPAPGTSGEDLSNVVTSCILDSTSWNDAGNGYIITVDVKVAIPVVEKKIVQHSSAGEKLVDADSADIGGKIDFRVTTTVPDLMGYSNYTYKITDTMSKGLTFNNDVAVKINGTAITEPEKVYDVEYATDQTSGVTTVTVAFKDFYKFITDGRYSQGDIITFDYSASLNEDAVIGSLGNPNKVKLTYSNDPYADTTNDTAEDTVKIYTFEFDIYKYTEYEGKGHPLSDAEFELRRSGGSDPIRFVSENGKYYVYSPAEIIGEEPETTVKIVSDEAGYIRIYGLSAGTYILKETKAPKGYVLSSSPIEIRIEPEYDSVATTELSSLKAPEAGDRYGLLTAGEEPSVEYFGVRCSVENNSKAILSNTGGMGRTVFCFVGMFLIAIAVIALVSRSFEKKKTAD